MRYASAVLSKLCFLTLLLGLSSAVRAEYVDPLGYSYYLTLPGDTQATFFSTPQEAAHAFIAGGNSYYSGSNSKITYTLQRVYPCAEAGPPSCNSIDWFLDWHFSSKTNETDYKRWKIFVRLICPSGYISGVAYNKCWRASPPPPPPPPALALSLSASAPVIPQASQVASGKVLTRTDLLATVLERGSPAAGKTVSLQSNRAGAVDNFSPSASLVTDAAGKAKAQVSTRLQPGSSTLSGTLAGLATPSQTSVAWLPAKYEGQFLVTCYTIANESLAPEEPSTSGVCGLPEKQSYRSAFLKDVKMQGSGEALDGTIVHYSGRGCYNTDTCARTATGACAAAGTTIAVDPKIIPKKSTVNVKIIGSRKAQDTGGMINGYHIDEYVGAQPKLCKQLGRRTSDVSFENY
jgi:3D (Asp-Asp-Asp) domain-containing protein